MDRVLRASLAELRRDRTSIKWVAYPPDVVPAWVAEMDCDPCPAVVDAVGAALRRGDTGYTNVRPYAEAMSAYARDEWGWELAPGRAVSVPDVMIGLLEMIRLFTDEGGAVVVSPPVYDSFYGFIRGYGREVVTAPLSPEGRLDPSALDRAFGEAVRGGRRAAYVLCNPHNPVGAVHTRAELEQLALLADAHGVRVVSDEIHAPLVLEGPGFVPYLSVAGGERGIALHSASKAWNLAGLKCALAVPGADAVADLARMPEVATHGAAHVAAIAHTAALTDGRDWGRRLRAELLANRDHLAARLAAEAPDVAYAPGAATYLAWLDLRATGLGDEPAAELLRRARVALSRGLNYGEEGRGFARLNFATSPEVLDEVVDRVVAGLGRG